MYQKTKGVFILKKILSIGLSLMMTASLLAGCGGNDNNAGNSETGNSSNTNSATNDTTSNDDVYEMVMEIITYGFDDPDLQMVEDAVNGITVPEIGVKVKFMTVPIGEMSTKLGLLVSGNEKIDLVCTGLLTTPANLASDGLIQPITEYVENSEALSQLAEGIIDACKVNGEIYAYPGATANGNQISFYYDSDLAKEYNIQVPDTITSEADWNNLFAQVEASGMEQYPISLGDGAAAEGLWAEFDELGDSSTYAYGVVMDENDTVVNYYATDTYKEKCKMHRDWYEQGYCVPDSISNGYTTSDSMTQGMIFGFVSGGGVGMSSAYWSKITGKNIQSIPLGEIYTHTSNLTNFSWGVSSSCERPDKVIGFLELLYTDTDLANTMNYGIEGVHYVTNEGSQIISYPDGVDASNCGYGAFVGTYGDNSKIYQREPLTDEFVEHISDFMYPNATPSKYLGYTFDPSEVSTELTAVTAVVGQYATALECGTVDPDVMIPEFLDALDAAGMDKIIEANQAQLDAWLAQQ